MYAAHDHLAIYAVAVTPDAAIAQARDPEAQFSTARISETLAARIIAEGWNGFYQAFDVIDGSIVETPDD